MPDERLHRNVLQAIARGLLPASLPTKTWGGFGNGNSCSVCGHTITAEQLETEFENGARRPYHLHIQCFAAWEAIARSSRLAEPALPLSEPDGYSAVGEQPSRKDPR